MPEATSTAIVLLESVDEGLHVLMLPHIKIFLACGSLEHQGDILT